MLNRVPHFLPWVTITTCSHPEIAENSPPWLKSGLETLLRSSFVMSSVTYTRTKAYMHLIQLLMHPLTYRPHNPSHTHIHTYKQSDFCSSSCACPVADLSLQSVIVAPVARTDRPAGDRRWHAPIISGPSAVFAITESLVEHTESDSGVSIQKPFQLQMAAQLLLTTASPGPGLS